MERDKLRSVCNLAVSESVCEYMKVEVILKIMNICTDRQMFKFVELRL